MKQLAYIFIMLLYLFFSPLCTHATEQTDYSFYSDTESIHFEHFIKEIRCVVCQNQSLADSHAPLAEDLRQKIADMIHHKKTDEEIKNYLVKRYGEFILLNPRINSLTILLWLFPFLGVIFIFLFIWYLVKSSSDNKIGQYARKNR